MSSNAEVAASIIGDIEKQYGKGAATVLSDGGLSTHIPGVIPSGSAWLDYSLGRGGWPLSRIVLVGGDEGAGKTTLALQACASVQRMGGIAFYIDAEYKLDMMYADAMGCDVDTLIMSQPEHLEAGLDMVEKAILRVKKVRASTGVRIPVLVVFDSISSIPPKDELEGSYEDNTIGLAARQMGKGLRKLVKLVSEESVCLMLVSQLREKIGVMFGDDLSTSCGKAPLFYAATIVRLTRGKADRAVKKKGKGDDEDDAPAEKGGARIGAFTHVYVHKNQVAPPHRKCELLVRYGQGVEPIHGLHNAATATGWAVTRGSWVISDSADVKWCGQNGLAEMDQEERDAVEASIRESYDAAVWSG